MRRSTPVMIAVALLLASRPAGAREDREVRLAKLMRLSGILTVTLAGTAGLALGITALTEVDSRRCVEGPCDTDGSAKELGIGAVVSLVVAFVAGTPLWTIGQARLDRARGQLEDEPEDEELPEVRVSWTDGGGRVSLGWRF
jgi:hypothetical protein